LKITPHPAWLCGLTSTTETGQNIKRAKKGGTFVEQARPDDDLKPWNVTMKTKTQTELPLFPLPDGFTETRTLEMPERELTAMP